VYDSERVAGWTRFAPGAAPITHSEISSCALITQSRSARGSGMSAYQLSRAGDTGVCVDRELSVVGDANSLREAVASDGDLLFQRSSPISRSGPAGLRLRELGVFAQTLRHVRDVRSVFSCARRGGVRRSRLLLCRRVKKLDGCILDPHVTAI
jgi:hypothetical protein